MRRTRHVVLPVRSWQYIGLLIVSLACLTLGLVSRDREGHSGNLAGPELTHRAPHEVDACPNVNPFTKMPVNLNTEPEKALKSVNYREIKASESPASRRLMLSRSSSLDRLSRIVTQKIEEQSSKKLKTIERLSRSTTRVPDNESINRLRESRFRTIAESRSARNSFNPTFRFSRSQDSLDRANDRRFIVRDLERRVTDHSRSRSIERHELGEIARRVNRIDRSTNRENSRSLRSRTNDRRSLSMERRRSNDINRQESRDVGRRESQDLTRARVDRRSETRERRLRSVERRDTERLNRREDRKSLLKARSENIEDVDRNNNLNHRQRSLETRRALLDRVANQQRRSRVSIVTRNSREDLARSNDRRLQFRSMERIDKSFESNIEKSSKRGLSSERGSLARSAEINRIEHRRVENRLFEKRSLDRATSRASSEDVRRERINRSRRITSLRDSRENAGRINSRITPARSLHDFEDTSSRERRERRIRSSRSVDRRELPKINDSKDRRSRDSSAERRDITLERRERTNRVYRSREERRIIPQRSREQIERRISRIPERRVSERRDSRRSSEREINENARSREIPAMIDRRLEQNPELRISHERILEKRSIVNARKSLERRIDERSRSREGSRMQNRRVERNSELRDAISMRMLDRRSNRETTNEKKVLRSLEKRSDARRDRRIGNLDERRAARSVESLEKDSVRHLRHRSLNLNVKDSSRLAFLRRVARVSRIPEQNREQRTSSTERMISRVAFNDRLSAKWEQNSRDANVEKIEAKIIPESMNKYPTYLMYDLIRQAFVMGLCTVYGLSLYNGKKTFFGTDMIQQMQRLIVW